MRQHETADVCVVECRLGCAPAPHSMVHTHIVIASLLVDWLAASQTAQRVKPASTACLAVPHA
jgi:hypothetical protein